MNNWILPDLASALMLGFYDTSKKSAVLSNNVVMVLFLTTLFTAIFSPVLLLLTGQLASSWRCPFSTYLLIWIKSLIVGSSWYFGYQALAQIPLSLWTPIRATAPLWTFLCALLFYHEVPTFWKGIGMLLIFTGYYVLSIWGHKEGFTLKDSPGIRYCLAGTILGALSATYDKFLLNVRHIPVGTVQLYFCFNLAILFLIVILAFPKVRTRSRFKWRWAILSSALLLLVADYIYFYAVSLPDIQISQVSLVRRTSSLVSFAMGAIVYKDKHIGGKAIALLLILCGVAIMALL